MAHRARTAPALVTVALIVAGALAACGPSAPTAPTAPTAQGSAADASSPVAPAIAPPASSAPASDGPPASASASAPTAPAPGSPIPSAVGEAGAQRYDHVIWIWMENREASSITAASAPYLAGLARTYGYAADYYGVSHPSEPNYVAAVAGSPLGVTTDGAYQLTDPSLFDQVTKAGLSWRVYAQDYPGACFTGTSSAGGSDGPGAAGTYVRKHDPAISFTSISGSPAACASIQPLRGFSPVAASFEFVVPNLTNDMHDGSTAQGDAFLRAFVPSILHSPDWASTVLVITFDEGSTSAGQMGDRGGPVFTAVVRQGLSHVVSLRYYDHYSLLRTTEAAFGLLYLGSAATRSRMADLIP